MCTIAYSLLALLALHSAYSGAHNNGTSLGSPPTELREPLISSDRRYVAITADFNWWQASLVCNSNGYRLASVNSWNQYVEFHEFIVKYVANDESATEIPQHLEFWIGGSDLAAIDPALNQTTARGNWSWVGNGRPVFSNNWDVNEPSVSGACLQMGWNFKWQSRECYESKGVICESFCPSRTFTVTVYE